MSMLQINHRKRVANLCGKLQAPVTFLSEGAMDVFFITNSNVSMKGFRIEYTAEFGKQIHVLNQCNKIIKKLIKIPLKLQEKL